MVGEYSIFWGNDDQVPNWVHGASNDCIWGLILVGDINLSGLFIFVHKSMTIFGTSDEPDMFIEVDEIDCSDMFLMRIDLG